MKEITVKSILNKTKRRDPWFLDDYTLNPYSACGYNCLYCYIRGSKYGINLTERLTVKSNAVELLDKALSLHSRKGRYGIIVLASATEPYQLADEKTQLTRQLLQVILHYRFPVHIITKSTMVVRDFDLLQQIDKAAILPADLQGKLPGGTIITFSFSTLDETVGKQFEPGAPAPLQRLETLEKTVNTGFNSGVSMMPLLPYISDTDESLHAMFSAFKQAGARYVFPSGITLYGNEPEDNFPIMMRRIINHYPQLAQAYQTLFTNDNAMRSYQQALYAKLVALQKEYGLKDRII